MIGHPNSLANLSRPARTQRRLNAGAFFNLLTALTTGPCTYLDLVEASGLNIWTVRIWVRTGRAKGFIRICDWERNNRNIPSTMVFEWAPGKRDKPRPKMTDAQRRQAWRDRQPKKTLTAGMNQFMAGVA